jgi:hypothetical protein
MRPKFSPNRVVALTGAVALLLSFAHVNLAAAQTIERYHKTCIAYAEAGASSAECEVSLPYNKRFVIESATFGGSVVSSQNNRVEVMTTLWGGVWATHYVPAGFLNLGNTRGWWSGALPGRIFAEAPAQYSGGHVRLRFARSSTADWGQIRMTVTGYLEDM